MEPFWSRLLGTCRWLVVRGAALVPLGLGFWILAGCWTGERELRDLGDDPLASLSRTGSLASGRPLALIGSVAPPDGSQDDAAFVIGYNERMATRRVPRPSVTGVGPDEAVVLQNEVEKVRTPAFALVLEQGVLPIANRDYTIDAPPLVQEWDGGRLLGFIPGDTVLVIGTMTRAGFNARVVSGASLEDYRARARAQHRTALYWGCGAIALGLSVFAYLVLRRHTGRIANSGRSSPS
jgi:hypothetical protein